MVFCANNPYPEIGVDMLRKAFLTIILFVVFGSDALAQSQFSPVITKMENSIFGIDYSSQSDEMRLKRLEENIYGTTSPKSVEQRVAKLSKDLSADLMGQEIKPKEDSFAEDESTPAEEIPKADKNINYPIVNQLENQIFKKEYKSMDINQRLANLEQNVFKKVYNDDLNTRVERLRTSLIPSSFAAPASEEESTFDYDDVLSQNTPDNDKYFYKNYNKNDSVLDEYQSSADVTVPLGALEKSVFRKSFPDDSVSSRLSRLEAQVLKSNFSQEDPQTRLDRLSSAQRAQKSAGKYDNNRFSQHMSTAMQLGALVLMVLACIL